MSQGQRWTTSTLVCKSDGMVKVLYVCTFFLECRRSSANFPDRSLETVSFRRRLTPPWCIIEKALEALNVPMTSQLTSERSCSMSLWRFWTASWRLLKMALSWWTPSLLLLYVILLLETLTSSLPSCFISFCFRSMLSSENCLILSGMNRLINTGYLNFLIVAYHEWSAVQESKDQGYCHDGNERKELPHGIHVHLVFL